MNSETDLITLYIRSCVTGFVVAMLFVALILWQNVAGLGHLVMSSPEGWLAVIMLVVFNGIVFSGVQFGIRIMGLAEPDNQDPPAGKRDALPVLEPIAIPVEPQRR